MLSGIILAAGNSTRMGTPKALLATVEGQLFVSHIVRTWHTAGVRNVIVVTGRDHDAIAAAMTDDAFIPSPLIVQNADPSRGQLSSLIVGLDAAGASEGVLMTLVDSPLATHATVTAVIDAWRRSRAAIVRPAIGDTHGHPVLFDRVLFDELRRAPQSVGAKAVVRAHEREIVNVQVSDEGCVVDFDTPLDYDRYVKWNRRPPQN